MSTIQTAPKTIVCADTRRAIFMIAKGRKKDDVLKIKHEDFVRQALKTKMGWPKNEPAPESIKAVAKEIAATLIRMEKEAADAKEAKQAVPAS